MARHNCPKLFATMFDAYPKNALIIPFISAGIFVTCLYYLVFLKLWVFKHIEGPCGRNTAEIG